jgi:hypothetical protein
MTTVAQTAGGRTPPSFADRAVARLSTLLGRRATTRRSFLFRAAVLGSALAADPVGYVLKPGTRRAEQARSILGGATRHVAERRAAEEPAR